MPGSIRVRIIIDSRQGRRSDLHSVHGLSLFIEAYDRYILFDLGPADKYLIENSERLGIPLDLLDTAVISHSHSSHAGALGGLGWASPYLDTYIPYDTMQHLGVIAKKNGLRPIEVLDWKELWPYIYITPPIYGPPWEHFLIIRTNKGLLVFSGCTHPGIDKVVSTLKEKFPEQTKLYGWIGGFHLSNAPRSVVAETVDKLEALGLELVVPLHCSGRAMSELLSSTSIRVIEAGVGDTVDIPI